MDSFYWYCCQCGDGPNNYTIQIGCCVCWHSRCSSCLAKGKTVGAPGEALPTRRVLSEYEGGVGDRNRVIGNRNRGVDNRNRVEGNKMVESPDFGPQAPKIFQDSLPTCPEKSEGNFPEEDPISETASELSSQDHGYGSASTSSNASVLYDFAHEIATDLASNGILRFLLLDHLSTDTVANETFRHFLIDTLRRYSFDLKREASTQVHKDSYRLIRLRVSYLAWEILSLLGFVLAPSQFDGLQSQQADRSKTLENYLAKRAQKSIEAETENEIEDDISDGEEVVTMPNLSQAKNFLYEGQAFQLFLRRLQNNSTEAKLLEQVGTISQPPEGNSDASSSVPLFSIRLTISPPAFQMSLNLRKIFEAPSQHGKIRVRWTCRCGKPMYDDYKELVPGAVREFEQQLVSHFNQAADGLRERQGAGRRADFSGLCSWITNALGCFWNPSKRSDEEKLPVTRDQALGSQPQTAASSGGESLFLLLCAHAKSGNAPKLLQGRADDLTSDQDFFAFMKELYLQQCKVGKWSSLLSIRKIQDIRFVRFELLLNSLVNIRGDRPIPDSPDYVPYPADIGMDPPIAGNLLTHMFECPYDADTVLFLAKRIPRKRKNELRICEITRSAEGWGLHLVPGINWAKVCAVGLMFLVISLVFGIIWSVARKNVSEGFQVTS